MAYDVIILAGQSNAEGNGVGATLIPYESDDRILMMHDNQWYGYVKDDEGKDTLSLHEPYDFITEVAKERHSGDHEFGMFVLSFAKKYVENGLLSDGRKLLIINAAIGGTGFARPEWGVGKVLHERLFEMLKQAELKEDDRIVAFLWHQGEHDAFENAHFSPSERYNFYRSSLTDSVNDIRERLHNDKLPFIAGEFCHEWWDQNKEICDPVIKALKDVCSDVGCATVVSSQDLKSNNQSTGNSDVIHFCRDALMTLGCRYFDAFKEIAGEKNV